MEPPFTHDFQIYPSYPIISFPCQSRFSQSESHFLRTSPVSLLIYVFGSTFKCCWFKKDHIMAPSSWTRSSSGGYNSYMAQMLHGSPWCWNMYTYIWVIFRANVSKYCIHGASGVASGWGLAPFTLLASKRPSFPQILPSFPRSTLKV